MTQDQLFLWVMHRFSKAFEEHAIMKGGMALRLLDSPRSTTDIDYVFVPFSSKKDVRPRIQAVLEELDGAEVTVRVHSKMIRAELRTEEAAIQVEADVMPACRSTPMSTGAFARAAGHPAQVVRIMDLSVALAHKLAAWNERRLLRDLYDAHFLFSRAGAKPDREVLEERLANVVSRLPQLKKKKRMTRGELNAALRNAVLEISEGSVQAELGPLLPPAELAGLPQRMRVSLSGLVQLLEEDE
jgi:predicted nucleotidyltransferase component of viral defense system